MSTFLSRFAKAHQVGTASANSSRKLKPDSKQPVSRALKEIESNGATKPALRLTRQSSAQGKFHIQIPVKSNTTSSKSDGVGGKTPRQEKVASVETDVKAPKASKRKGTNADTGINYEDETAQIKETIKKRQRYSKAEPKVKCVGCNDTFPERRATYLPACGHHYCRPCLKNLILMCFKDETMYPPKCCKGVLSDGDVIKALNQKQLKQYRDKEAEYKIAAKERLYCPTCGHLVVQKATKGKKGKAIRCTKRGCKTDICGRCKKPYHEVCPDEKTDLQRVIDLAAQRNWKRCPGCHTMVERTMGCHQMTCTCKTRFCYRCGDAFVYVHYCKCYPVPATMRRKI